MLKRTVQSAKFEKSEILEEQELIKSKKKEIKNKVI